MPRGVSVQLMGSVISFRLKTLFSGQSTTLWHYPLTVESHWIITFQLVYASWKSLVIRYYERRLAGDLCGFALFEVVVSVKH